MIDFQSYGHIDNVSNSNSLIEYLISNDSSRYGCFRKIDGCNFQITIDRSENIKFGKRSSYVSDDSYFMNFHEVVDRYGLREKMRRLLYLVDENHVLDFDSITLFGELCGGFYAHKDVEKDLNAKVIQGRISYSPRNEFIAFDLRLNGLRENEGFYFNKDTLADYCDELEIPCQILEFRGSLKECIDFDISAINDDTGKRLFGYPEVQNQVIEGVVIKPICEETLNYDRRHFKRCVFKNKNEKFLERKAVKTKKEKEVELNDREQKWFDIMCEYINANRVMSAVSKVGKEKFNELFYETKKDALLDFFTDNKCKYKSELTEEESKKVFRMFAKHVSSVVRKVYLS